MGLDLFLSSMISQKCPWPKFDWPTIYDDKLWIRKITLEDDDCSADDEEKKKKWEISQE